METIKLQEVIDNYRTQKSEIEKKEGVIEKINAKLQQINGTQTEIQKWDKSIGTIKNHIDKATLLQAKLDAESKIDQLNGEIQILWNSIESEPFSKDADVSNELDGKVEDEKIVHRTWLNKNLIMYLGFALASLFMFMLIHGSQYLISHEWTELLNTFRYTHQIFLKISMGFFGILSMGISINLLIPSVLWYFNSKVNQYDFVADFLKTEPHTRLYVSCFVLYCLMEYWGKVMSWEIVL